MTSKKNTRAQLVHVGGSTLPNFKKADYLWWLAVVVLIMTIVFWTISLCLGGLHTGAGTLAFSLPALVILVRLTPDIKYVARKYFMLFVLFVQSVRAETVTKRLTVKVRRLRKEVFREWRWNILIGSSN
ncbi:MAG: hypothetical protein KBB54_00990 [Candidatus Pacebacteria bacterium]|nr:hypothetical protein [Candidatus Paceibacterota bacterium]MBP9818368.1 hypothetical protein [Candidatus Paceibacterota bacterium]